MVKKKLVFFILACMIVILINSEYLYISQGVREVFIQSASGSTSEEVTELRGDNSFSTLLVSAKKKKPPRDYRVYKQRPRDYTDYEQSEEDEEGGGGGKPEKEEPLDDDVQQPPREYPDDNGDDDKNTNP